MYPREQGSVGQVLRVRDRDDHHPDRPEDVPHRQGRLNNIEKMVVAVGPGLNSAAARFHVLLDIVPADNKRYRYAYHRSQWLVAGKADPAPQHRLYPHPDGPFSLDQLRKQVTSFEKVKITNNESDNAGYVSNSFVLISSRIANAFNLLHRKS